jgi:dipeptidyl aminopeptidase/acylaminoacyl peptidase
MLRPLALALSVALALTSVTRAQERRPIRETDLLDFVWAADPQISPDGSAVAYVRVVVNRQEDTYDSSIWVVPSTGGEPRAWTTGRRDTTPRWSPDGRRLAFLRPVEAGTRLGAAPQVHVLPLDGGEARAVTSLAGGVTTFAWSPDGSKFAVASNVRDAAGPPNEPGRPRPSDARVITRARFRADGGGYLDPRRRSRIFVVSAEGGGARALGRDRLDDSDPVWSPDGGRVYFTAQTAVEPDYGPPRVALMASDIEGREVTEVVAIDGTVTRPAPSPDGTRVAFIGVANPRKTRSHDQSDLFVADLATRKVTNLTERYDYDVGAGLAGDQRAPRGTSSSRPIWTSDGASLLAVVTVEGRAPLARFDARTGQATLLADGAHEVQGVTAASDGRLALLRSSQATLTDIFVAETPEATPRQVTHLNEALFSTLELPAPEAFWTKSFDGTRIHGWILKPAGFDESRKYPLILQIHGGPHAAYGETFTHEFLWMAARGYIVVYTNPRGSTSYGQDFGNVIQYRYPGDDHRDIMAALDAVIARGYVDTTRLGVTGGSGGGLLTNWALTKTPRFKAAVSQRSIADWSAWWYGADFTLFTPRWFEGPPWVEGKAFAKRSPISYVDKITTPLMLLDGDEDHRTPPLAGGEPMFRALKMRKVPVVMVRFPDEGHELSRSGAPWRRVDRLRHIVGWFDHWLLGKKRDEYQVDRVG